MGKFIYIVLAALGSWAGDSNPIGLRIRDAVKKEMPSIRQCYAQYVESGKKGVGEIVFGWTINEKGRLGDLKLTSDDIKDPILIDCISAKLKKISYPHAPKGVDVRINDYIFDFNQAH